ncbi:MAG: TorD/DmsD family molecular chaperone [Campylobacterota bacterium]
MNQEIEIDGARAVYYNLFANFFVLDSDPKSYFMILNIIDSLKQNPLDRSSEVAFTSLVTKLDNSSNEKLVLEFDEIFYAPTSANIKMSASFYDEGVENANMRLQMLDFLAKTDIRRDEKHFAEYEDNIGFIFAFLAQMIQKQSDEYKNLTHCVFEQVLNEFVDDFAKEVYEHPNADIYKDVITLLHSFIEFERLYLEVGKPKEKEKAPIARSECAISEQELERRARNKALKAKGPKK